MKIISHTDKDFNQVIETILKNRGGQIDSHVEGLVKKIISVIKQKGDTALFQLTHKYDRINLNSGNVKIPVKEIKSAYNKVPKKNIVALKKAASRIKSFHILQREKSGKNRHCCWPDN